MKERWLLETNSCGQFLVHSRKIVHAVFQKLYVWHHSNWKNNKEYGKKEKTDLTKKILLIVETLELTILVWGSSYGGTGSPPIYLAISATNPFFLASSFQTFLIAKYQALWHNFWLFLKNSHLLELPPLPILLLPLVPPILLGSHTPVPSPNLFRITYLNILPPFTAVFKLLE